MVDGIWEGTIEELLTTAQIAQRQFLLPSPQRKQGVSLLALRAPKGLRYLRSDR
jgi:hypothetical protein